MHTDRREAKKILMSVKDFYNAITPGSTLTHGVGRGVYTIFEEKDIASTATYNEEKLPTTGAGLGLLNKVQYKIDCL